MVRIKPARPRDIELLLANIRQADYEELTATHGEHADHTQILLYGLERSGKHAWSMYINGQLAGIGGVVPGGTLLGGPVGIAWILGTKLMDKYPGALTKAARLYFLTVSDVYPELTNFVDARNAKAIRWLRRLGFEFDKRPIECGPYSMPFYRFWKKTHVFTSSNNRDDGLRSCDPSQRSQRTSGFSQECRPPTTTVA